MSDPAGVARRPVLRRVGARVVAGEDAVAVEEPLEIRIGDRPIAVTMRTPGCDEELAAGFCLTEAIVQGADDLVGIEPCTVAEYGNVAVVELSESAAPRHAARVERARRELYVSSSCGLCGKESIDRVAQEVSALPAGFFVSPNVLASLPTRMRRAQEGFAATGGLHAAALFDADGDLRVLREDVGRHNAVDKVIGHEVLLGRLPIGDGILLVSGRASFEIVQKAAMGGVPVVCAVSAPSSLAVDLATRLCVTLVAFLRGDRMNVYTDGPGRVFGA